MNSINNIDLSKLKRYDQSWADMPENEKGRLCEKCSETIIDFRKKSKEEIAKAHVFSNTRVCGLYDESQLSIPTSDSKRSKIRNYSSSLYLALLSLISTPAFSQTKAEKPKVEQGIERPNLLDKTNIEIKTDSSKTKIGSIIKGRVVDIEGNGIAYATIFIEGSEQGTTSDHEGNYLFNISFENDSNTNIQLTYKSLGYQ